MTTAGFQKGQSGNPNGRPAGSRNKTTLAAEALLDGDSETITKKAIELALAGDMQAIRICMDRLCPPRKDRPVQFSLPPLNEAKDAVAAVSAIVAAVASGDLTPLEAGELSKVVSVYATTLEAANFEERLRKLETQK